MAKRNKPKNSKKNNSKFKAFIASFFTLIGFLIAILIWRDNKYVMHYAKQGLVLFIGFLILEFIPSISPLDSFISIALVLWIILWIITWVNALSGKVKKTFIVSDLAKKINL